MPSVSIWMWESLALFEGGEGCISGGRHARSVTEGSARGVRNETALLSLSIGDQKTTGNESDLNQLHIGITQSFTTSTQANRDSLLISLRICKADTESPDLVLAPLVLPFFVFSVSCFLLS